MGMMVTEEAVLRRANLNDLEALVTLEDAGFQPADRFDRERLRYLLTRANSTTLVYEVGGEIVGCHHALAPQLNRRPSLLPRRQT